MKNQPAPPPTRFGGAATIQPRRASVAMPPPPPTRYGPRAGAQAKAFAGAPSVPPAPSRPAAVQPKVIGASRPVPPPPTAGQPGRRNVVQKMEAESMEGVEAFDPMRNLEGFGNRNYRKQFRFTQVDMENDGFRTTAVAKLNGYPFTKTQSNSDGHAEDHIFDQLRKVTDAARRAANLFVEPPHKNLLTIYVTKSPCSSKHNTTEKDTGCTEVIASNKTINGYEFSIKVRYDHLYSPKGFGVGAKNRSEQAMVDVEKDHDINTGIKKFAEVGKTKTGRRDDPHPMRKL